jgi:hypothetical protein
MDGDGQEKLMRKSPVALIFFRRDCVMQVIDRIRDYAPEQLYLIADGGRTPEEHDGCLKLRARVEAAIDWPCDLRRRYSEVNLGCRKNIPAGLDWVFSEVDSAIILEDDCVPSTDFFPFCQEMLETYLHDPKIFLVSGSNHVDDPSYFGENSYLFSGYTIIWGWATWARAWSNFDAEMKLWPEAKRKGLLKSMFLNREQELHWDRIFESVWNHKCNCDPWDYQWTFATWLNAGLSIIPRANLITNEGVGPLATHTTAECSYFAGRPSSKLAFPLVHPSAISQNLEYDKILGKLVYYGPDISGLERLRKYCRRIRSALVSTMPSGVKARLKGLRSCIRNH